jgi:hypothetical protein
MLSFLCVAGTEPAYVGWQERGRAEQDDSKKEWASSTIFTLRWKDLLHFLEMIETAHPDFVSTLMDLSDKQVGNIIFISPPGRKCLY